MNNESLALKKRLQKEYGKSANFIAARGNAKPTLTSFRFHEGILAQAFIKSISDGENLTEADWEREVTKLHEETASYM